MKPFAIHWFRRDLRIAGNPALQYALKKYEGRVLGLFSFDASFLGRQDFSANRFGFFLNTLSSLREEMRAQGGDLLVVDALPVECLEKIVDWIRREAKEKNIAELCHNRDYEPFARKRDSLVQKLLGKLDLPLHTERDHLMIEPCELEKDGPDSFYQVYTPFSKRWFQLKAGGEFRDRFDQKIVGLNYLKKAAAGEFEKRLFQLKWKDLGGKNFPYPDQLEAFLVKNKKMVTISLPPAGSKAVWESLQAFKKHLARYDEHRDLPSLGGTSRFSIYFKNGSLTPAQAVAFFGLQDCALSEKNSRTKFLQELVWREFYYHILYHCPRVEKEAFLAKYKHLEWQTNPAWLERWQKGETGFPIVDAGMRQLRQTGWMHNRVRMIVASFLTKDLLISWQEGEKFFMRELLDGDLAPNNGGWQWAASTGCDPQPYFRVFNPWLQGAKFDPKAEYIRKYLPELKAISLKDIHDPEGNRGSAYPKPMVEHARRKVHALALYKNAK
ncbi:MAG: deoxyribodipyrimidine photo-lyase [Bacteriovoracia bacterium]